MAESAARRVATVAGRTERARRQGLGLRGPLRSGSEGGGVRGATRGMEGREEAGVEVLGDPMGQPRRIRLRDDRSGARAIDRMILDRSTETAGMGLDGELGGMLLVMDVGGDRRAEGLERVGDRMDFFGLASSARIRLAEMDMRGRGPEDQPEGEPGDRSQELRGGAPHAAGW